MSSLRARTIRLAFQEPSLRPWLLPLLVKRAKIVGAAVRTAHMVSIGVDGILDKCSLSFSGDELIMQIPRACAHLDGERLRRRFSTLANLVDRKPRIEFAN